MTQNILVKFQQKKIFNQKGNQRSFNDYLVISTEKLISMPIRKNARIYLVTTPAIKKELTKEAKKSKKYITEILLEGWELYKKKHWLSINFDK